MHELIKYQFNTRRKKYGTGAALSLLNGNVGREVLGKVRISRSFLPKLTR